MNTVWALFVCYWEGDETLEHIYSTKEKAIEERLRLEAANFNFHEIKIEEWSVE